MYKILAISGSARKNGVSSRAFQSFTKHFDSTEYAIELIHLSEVKLDHCKGCTICFKTTEKNCPLHDDFPMIAQKMNQANGIVFISPIYEMNVSSTMKLLLDRAAYMLHRPTLHGTHSLVILSTDIAGLGLVSKYMSYMMNAFGMKNTGYIGVKGHKYQQNDRYLRDTETLIGKRAIQFKEALSSGHQSPPTLSLLVRFNAWSIKNQLSKDIYPGDYEYWLNKGWFDSDYYYPIKLNPLKKILLSIIRKRLHASIRKSLH